MNTSFNRDSFKDDTDDKNMEKLSSAISAVEALDKIFQVMDAEEWSADTLDRIAEILTEHGYKIRDPEGDFE